MIAISYLNTINLFSALLLALNENKLM